MEKLVFADTFTKTFKKVLKTPTVYIDDPIFRLHYKFTGLALLFGSIMVSGYEFFGKPMLCIQKDDIPEKLLNSYCWVEGTFTLPKALFKDVGTEVVYPGVDQYLEGDEVTEHAYYQWVCFVLFLQAVLFCVPHILWRTLEAGRMRNLIQELTNPVLAKIKAGPCYTGLVSYFDDAEYRHNYYAMKYLFCEFLNFVNVVGQIYFINKFLGGEFTKYGINVVRYINDEQYVRVDPMIKVFPRMTKCTFHKYGSSGTVQKHDALCLLPLNILNEKIFVVMWFWFVILACLGGSLLLYRFITIFSNGARYRLLNLVSKFTTKSDLEDLNLRYGDWFLLYLLADNIDSYHFKQFFVVLKEPYLKQEAKAHNMFPHYSQISEVKKDYKVTEDKTAGKENQRKIRRLDEVDKGKKSYSDEKIALMESHC